MARGLKKESEVVWSLGFMVLHHKQQQEHQDASIFLAKQGHKSPTCPAHNQVKVQIETPAMMQSRISS
jgi:hypothetical protein